MLEFAAPDRHAAEQHMTRAGVAGHLQSKISYEIAERERDAARRSRKDPILPFTGAKTHGAYTTCRNLSCRVTLRVPKDGPAPLYCAKCLPIMQARGVL
jgi:hypothetical protein